MPPTTHPQRVENTNSSLLSCLLASATGVKKLCIRAFSASTPLHSVSDTAYVCMSAPIFAVQMCGTKKTKERNGIKKADSIHANYSYHHTHTYTQPRNGCTQPQNQKENKTKSRSVGLPAHTHSHYPRKAKHTHRGREREKGRPLNSK
ncbi:hypothetical protein TCDM_10353 [Trypanosoma cruzi Dm28c]|uniref:Uncharacterized protein n=1 Tax=Trypanosoma cruzi Dm28c TaxID=1416333 RepID=V5AMT2_TRYCR|nr:hypothetical protein TCDM_10353 [Trypanosoma cruzi Dm28c]